MSESEIVLGIDFDRVLFKTEEFNDYLKEKVEGLEHVETPPYNEHEVYSPEIHAEMCGIEVDKIYDVLDNLERFLYDDIQELENFNGKILIVTRGETKFQEAKIEGSGADSYTDDVIIVEKGSKNVGQIDFLIDDQKREIAEAEIPGFEFDRERHSLKDALDEVKNHATR